MVLYGFLKGFSWPLFNPSLLHWGPNRFFFFSSTHEWFLFMVNGCFTYEIHVKAFELFYHIYIFPFSQRKECVLIPLKNWKNIKGQAIIHEPKLNSRSIRLSWTSLWTICLLIFLNLPLFQWYESYSNCFWKYTEFY